MDEQKFTIEICTGERVTRIDVHDYQTVKEFERKLNNCLSNPEQYPTLTIDNERKAVILTEQFLRNSIIFINKV